MSSCRHVSNFFSNFCCIPFYLLNSSPGTTFFTPLLLHPSLQNKTKPLGMGACKKIETVVGRDTVSKNIVAKPPTRRHDGYIRLQMAESGHEDEHATLLGDEGLRAGGQVLKLG